MPSTPPTDESVYEANYRFPEHRKRWQTLGTFPTQAAAQKALDKFVAESGCKFTDQWIHRVPAPPKGTPSLPFDA